jgi:hypothetical protein
MPDTLICYQGSIENLKLLGVTYLPTAMKPARTVNSNDDPNLDRNEGEIPNPFMEEERVKKSISSPLDGKFHESNSQKEVLNCKRKAPGDVTVS